jgi:hypothetical protein
MPTQARDKVDDSVQFMRSSQAAKTGREDATNADAWLPKAHGALGFVPAVAQASARRIAPMASA